MKDRRGQFAALTASAIGTRKVLELADAHTRISRQIKLVTTDTQNLSAAYEAVLRVANNSCTSLESTSEIYTKINPATRSLGVFQQSVVDTTDAVSKAVSIFGGNAQLAQTALFQFS